MNKRDYSRQEIQRWLVMEAMRDGNWWTLWDLQARLQQGGCNAAETSISARVRDLRKGKYGGHQVQRRYRGKGVYEYRLIPAVAEIVNAPA